MIRKTNLFYTTGPDSKFITFSNYTELLTGNFLSINTKLFPDKFLCLKINNLNSSTKAEFIKYIAAYYENKLAALRDTLVKNNKQVDTNIYPLSYLLEAIINVVEKDENGEWRLTNSFNNEINYQDNNLTIDNLITYIGDVTEYDYNGTYTDTICSINMSSYNEGSIIYKTESTFNQSLTCTINSDKLYGWENDNVIFDGYENVSPVYDALNGTKGSYNFDTKLTKIIYNEIDEHHNDYGKTLKFNIIIPLFSYINIDKATNTNIIDGSKKDILDPQVDTTILDPKFDSTTNKKYLDLITNNNGTYDVPLGMWIYGDNENDTFIELVKDNNLNLYPTWSLLIGSQFKPFPYSNDVRFGNETQNSTLHGFPTFAETLTKVNEVLDKFDRLNINLINLTNEVKLIKSQLNNISTEANVSKLDSKILTIKSEVDDQLSEFKQQMYGYINNLKWSYTG